VANKEKGESQMGTIGNTSREKQHVGMQTVLQEEGRSACSREEAREKVSSSRVASR
jgi:hypothetical protein